MRKYLLPKNGIFYKANLHCHSNISDGNLSPEEIKKLYKENGYSIVAYTDHDVLIDHSDLKDDDFLPLNGYEMEVNEEIDGPFYNKKSCHMCLIALDKDNLTQVCYHRTKYMIGNGEMHRHKVKFDDSLPDYERRYGSKGISEMMKIGRDNGFFVTYNHPSWSLENLFDYSGYNNMHAMEICNGGCVTAGYCDYNEKDYDEMLRLGKRIYAIAADDNHNRCADYFAGFTMIKADKLEYNTVTNALVKGDFYASQGPEIYDLYFEDGKVYVKCSDAKMIKLNTAVRIIKTEIATDGNCVNEACFEVKDFYRYFRITVIDKEGKCANTNAYFTDEFFK